MPELSSTFRFSAQAGAMVPERYMMLGEYYSWLTPRIQERAPQERFLLEGGVRACADEYICPSPIPFDSPCYHGLISPTVVSSERFWASVMRY